MFLFVRKEADCGAEIFKVYVGEERSLEFSFHRAPTGPANIQEDHRRLTQQPVDQFIRSGSVQAGQDTFAPQTDVKYVGSHACTGTLWITKECVNKSLIKQDFNL